MKEQEASQKIRTKYLDYLRIFSTFFVILVHVTTLNWYVPEVNDINWHIFNFYDSIGRWAAAIFVMISGAIFLNRTISFKKIYFKYVLRMIITFIIWSLIYSLGEIFYCFFRGRDISNALTAFITGHYHMWFILMIIGIYMCMPFFKKLIEEEFLVKYFLVLSFIFAFAIPTLFTFANDFCGESTIVYLQIVKGNINYLNINIVMGYAAYFILGYYIANTELTKKQINTIYLLGILGFAATVLLNLFVAIKTQTRCNHYYDAFTVNVFFETLSVFTFFKYRTFKNDKVYKVIQKLSIYNFGAYLVHPLVIEQLHARLGLNSLSFHPILAVPVIAVIVFIIAYTMSAILNHIPILNKYIV